MENKPTLKLGDQNPDGYGKVYAIAKDGTAYVLDRGEYCDALRSPRVGFEWRVHIKGPNDRKFDWNETYDRRKDAIAWIRAAVAAKEVA